MGQVPEQVLERLKTAVRVEDLARAHGVRLRKHGQHLKGLCPFHDDSSPSLIVTPSKNLWSCLGACRKGGTTIDWVMAAEGVGFRRAVELLQGGYPLAGKSTAKDAPTDLSPVDVYAPDTELLDDVAGYYHRTLLEDAGARAYLASRGLCDDELIKRFQLGYANRTLGQRLPRANRKLGSDVRSKLQAAGVLRETGHEHLNGCIVFPLFDERGRVVQMYGRKTTKGLKPELARHLYLPGGHAGVFNRDAAVRSNWLIVCESVIDACTFWRHGFTRVTTTYGTSGLTDELLELLKTKRRVYLAQDRDEAGEKAAAELGERLLAVGVECFRVQFPKGMDANTYARKVQPSGKSLELSLRRARWLGKGTSPAPFLEDHDEERAFLSRAAAAGPEATQEPPTPELRAEPGELSPSLAADEEAESTQGPLPVEEPQQLKEDAPDAGVACEVEADEVRFSFGKRRWRARGVFKNMAPEVLKVNLLVGDDDAFHVDTFDLYAHKHRSVFLRTAADELGAESKELKRELGRVLLKLEQLQHAALRDELSPKDKVPDMTDQEREEALSFLKQEDLLDQVLRDFDAIGVVGEETNKLVGYLAAVSRKLSKPLAVMVQSSSAAGKSSLMEAVLSFVPDEEKVAYSAMTGQSLFYMEDGDLRHKVLAIAEEEGAERASYALKVLQSEGRLRIASTGKDPTTGRHVTSEYEVEGPVAIFSTTTAIDVDEELLNRCLVLSVDEGAGQTGAIHERQRDRFTAVGLQRDHKRKAVLTRQRNAQRLLRPLAVVNPYAPQLTFPTHRTRLRRDHDKYLNLMSTIALLHQHQRELKHLDMEGERVEYVDVELLDIEVANRLAHHVLGRSLDELPPQTRRLLEHIDALVQRRSEAAGELRRDVRFTRREVREASGLGNTQLKVHMQRLEELEYVVVRSGGRGKLSEYELLYDGQGKDGAPFFMGLRDVSELARPCEYDANWSGQSADRSGLKADRSPPGRGQVGPKSPPGRGAQIAAKLKAANGFPAPLDDNAPKSTSPVNERASYVHEAGEVR